MALVKDLMTRDVITIPPNASVAELIRRLDESRISGLPVVDEQEFLVGVISSRDVLRLAKEMGKVPEALRWGLSVPAGSRENAFLSGSPAGEFFAYYVTPEGAFVDVRDRIRDLPEDMFEGYRVEDVMTPVPLTIGPEATVSELAHLLLARNIHRALVVDSGKLVGLVSTTDILKALAED